jgi:hypothetical protein
VDADAPLVYCLLGIPDSGRRELLYDLIEGGIEASESVLYFRPKGEAPCNHDAQIEALANVTSVEWTLEGTKLRHGKISAAPTRIIVLAPGTCDPADCMEALKVWTDHNACRLARIITLVHADFLSKESRALPWFDACIHFSDVVLLGRREEAGNRWVRDFTEGYAKACNPARFLLLKKGRVGNPAEVLDPHARRLSLYFDELIPIEDDEFEDEHQPEDTRPDPYIERLESGRRAKPIPDLSPLLPRSDGSDA